MTEFIHVREAAGRVVRMPDGKRLPEGGALVPKIVFVMRCIADGDLEVVPEARRADVVPEARHAEVVPEARAADSGAAPKAGEHAE